MKQFLILAALIVGSAFGQLRFSEGAFYGDVAISAVSNYTLIGSIPAGASLVRISVGQSVNLTNEVGATNSFQVGIKTQTNYFVISTACPVVGSIAVPTTLSNSFRVLSSTTATPIYAYLTRLGSPVTAVGTYRFVVRYVQK